MPDNRSLGVRLAVENSDRVRQEFERLGLAGTAAAQRIVQSLEPANARLDTFRARLVEGGRGLQQFAKDVQRADDFLAKGIVELQEHGALIEASARKYLDAGQAAATAAVEERRFAEAVGRVDASLRQRQAREDAAIASAWKLAEANRAAAAAEQERNRAMAAQAQFNQVLGIGSGGAGAAQQSAAVFEEAFRAQERLTAAARRYRDELSPTLPLLRDYRARLTEINQLAKAGEISEREQATLLARTRAAYEAKTAAVRKSQQATESATSAVSLQGHQIANLGQQLQDVVVSLGSGQNPFIVLLQQGPQATSAVGGVSNAIALLRQTISPATVAAVAFGAGLAIVTARAYANEQALRQVDVAMSATGRSGLVARDQVGRLIDRMAELPTVSRSAAREIAVLFAAQPNIGAGLMQGLAQSVADTAAAMRTDAVGAATALAAAFERPGEGAVTLERQFRFLSASQLRLIQDLDASGRRIDAQNILLQAWQGRTQGLADQGIAPLAKALDNLSKTWDGLMETLANNTVIVATVNHLDRLLTIATNLRAFAVLANPLAAARGLAGAATAERESASTVTVTLPPIVNTAPKEPELPDPEKINSLLDRYGGLSKQARDLANDLAQLNAEFGRQKKIFEAGGEGAKTAAKEMHNLRFAIEHAEEAQRTLMTASQRSVEQSKSEQRVAQASLADRQRVRLEEQRRLAMLQEGGTYAEKTAAANAAYAAGLAQLAAAANDNVLAMQAEIAGSLQIAAAWGQGAAAAHEATIAVQARSAAMRDGNVVEAQHKQLLLEQAAAQQLIAGARAVNDLQVQAAAQERVTAAVGLSAEAQAEVARQNEVARFSAEQLSKATAKTRDDAERQIATYDELTKKRLADAQAAARQKAVSEALTQASLAEAKATVAGIPDAAQRRAGELDIARLQKMIELTREYGDVTSEAARAQLDAFDRVQAAGELERYFEDIRQKAEAWAGDISQFLIDGFVNAGEGGKSVFDDLWDGALQGGKRMIANLVAEFVKQQFILPITTSIVGGAADLFGITAPQRPGNNFSLVPDGKGGFSLSSVSSGIGLANTISGGGLFSGVTDFLGVSNLFGTGSGFLGLPGFGTALQTIGGTLGIGSGVATGTMAATTAAGSAAAAEVGAAAAGSALAPGLGASLATVALPIAAIAIPLIAASLFKSKPSNQGAEFSFMTDEGWTEQFAGTKHEDRMNFVRQFAEPLQGVIGSMEDRFGIARRPDATIGTTFGLKEGSAFFYDRGDRDGGIANRATFAFDPNDQASIQAALDQLAVEFVKDADWSGLGARLGEQTAADVATALEASGAKTLTDLLADISFAESFQSLADLSTQALDPVALAMRAVGNEGKQLAATLAGNVDTFREKASALGLGTEELEGGLTRADAATQGYILTVLGIEAPIGAVASATQRANGFITDLVPILEDAGFSVDRIGEITSTVFDKMVADAEAMAAEMRRAMTAAAIDIRTGIEQAINPAYQMSALDLFATQGLDTTQYGRLLGLVSGAATGDQAALRQVGDRLIYNLDPDNDPETAGYITQAQADAIRNYATSAYLRAVAPQSGGYEPANDNGGSVTSGGGGSGSSSSSDGARKAIQAEIDARRDEQRAIEQSISVQERLRDSYLDLAGRIAAFRQSLLVSDLSPLTPLQQLEEARRQYTSTLALAVGGDQDAIGDLEGVTRTFLDKSARYWASSSGQLDQSVRYQEDFQRVQADLLKVEGKARDYQAEAVAQLVTLNGSLGSVKTAIDNLGVKLDGLGGSSGGGSSGGSGGGSSGGGSTPTTPPAGYYLDSAGNPVKILFGMQSLGRGANEAIGSFMQDFQSYTGALTETAAYAWMQEAHPSGLEGLSRLEYFAAARRAGYPTTLNFGASDHVNWLNARTDGSRWRDFVDRLREYATVPVGFFAYAGAPANYAKGGVFDGGNILPFPGSWQGVADRPTLFDMGRMGEFGPEAVMPLVSLNGGGLGVRATGGGSDDAVVRAIGRLDARLERIERELQDDKVQRAEGVRMQVSAVREAVSAIRRNRPIMIDQGGRQRMTP